ncbi:PREDICTED: uncharacterized protein LOC109478192 [Branchiostoma belcheri]|uniref:Uncharacterized protein LOC109478192 n=1 Tax=Branchiostoma belcheri TaxID=7741 RepID=A0A6P4Z0W6_BRABE|nr:PREDICTED: uncharacterized protein LOC109478192 [Branchiostoma belcheri]
MGWTVLVWTFLLSTSIYWANGNPHNRAKRAVPPAVAAFVADAAKDVGGKVVDKLGDRIADAVVENHREKVVSSLENYFSDQFDKADEKFDQVMATGGDLLSGLGGNVKQARVKMIHGRGTNTGDTFSPAGYELRFDVERSEGHGSGNDDSTDGMSPALYPSGVGPLLMNACFGTNYAPGDPCYEGFVPIEACANIIDGATVVGVGFDGHGEYSTDSRKKSLIQRSCQGLQGVSLLHEVCFVIYKEYHVPDIMTVQGIYDTDVATYSFSSVDEYRHYLEDKSAVTSQTGMFQKEMTKVQGHLAVSGFAGMGWSAGGGGSTQEGRAEQTEELNARSQASARLTESTSRTFMAMMELNVFRYEIFLDFVTPEDLNLAFLRDFLGLPETYSGLGGEFLKFILRWGTHYTTAAKFGGQLKIIKTKEASEEASREHFAQAAQSDFKKVFSTYSAQQTQTKSSSFWHDHEKKTDNSEERAQANRVTSSSESQSEEGTLSQYEFSNEMMVVQGGDQRIAAAITEFYTTSFGNELKDWLESIDEFPKAFEFNMQLITDLLDLNFDTFFPQGNETVDFGCFGKRAGEMKTDKQGYKYYVQNIGAGANKTGNRTEIRYCKFGAREDIENSIYERRLALKRAIGVYLLEGPFVPSEFQIPAGEPGCETAELMFDDSDVSSPSWDELTGGNEFKVIFDLPYKIPNLLAAKAALNVKFVTKFKVWLTIREGLKPHLYDGHQNGNSGEISQRKISVGGLVMTYEEDTGTFVVTSEDYEASKLVIPDLPAWINGMRVARAEYKSLREHINKNSDHGQQVHMPCNMWWSNALRIDPTNGGKCIHFTAASEGDIFIVFAGSPKDQETWITVEISTSGVVFYKAKQSVVSQLDRGAQGPGSETVYQSYFVCISENNETSATLVEFGKTPDNKDRGNIWLGYLFAGDIPSVRHYAFGSGDRSVMLMGVSQIDNPERTCLGGTTEKDGRCVQRCHDECIGCMITGSNDPRRCVECKHVKLLSKYIQQNNNNDFAFECVAACPSGMVTASGTNRCKCNQVEKAGPDGSVRCLLDCGSNYYNDNGVCKAFADTEWRKIPGKLKQVEARSSGPEAWGVDSNGNVFKLNAAASTMDPGEMST